MKMPAAYAAGISLSNNQIADDPARLGSQLTLLHLAACHFPVADGEKLASEKATILHTVEGFLAEAPT
jgi:hypothetical protein